MRKRFVVHIALLLSALIAGMFLAELRQPTPATAQAPIKLKMQASWPSTSLFMDNFKMFAERRQMFPSYEFAADHYWKNR
jgi:TRAP-type mannitol/chloroaromatic compound transport system substrate-binding protein